MYTVIAFSLVGVFIGCYSEVRNYGWSWDIIVNIIGGLIVGGTIGLVTGVCLPVRYKTSTWAVNLESLQDGGSVTGSFFLGCGTIDGTMKYTFYYMNEDSTYQMWQVNYQDALIRFTNGKAREIVTEKRPSKSFYNKFAIDLSDCKQSFIFEVPRGSIKNNFILDAQ